MKKIKASLFVSHGYGCDGCQYSSEDDCIIEIDDTTYATLVALSQGQDSLDEELIQNAISEGHSELQCVVDAISKKQAKMEVEYWLFEADNTCIDDSLEPSFWDDIAAGLYFPDGSVDVCSNEHIFEPEEENDPLGAQAIQALREEFYHTFKKDYLDWVYSQNDCGFIADRVGLDLEAVYEDMPELQFAITLTDVE